MKKSILIVMSLVISYSVKANDLIPVALQSSTPNQTWFYNLEDVVFDSDDSYVPNGYISYTKWYINGVEETGGSYRRSMSMCFALYGSPANGCYQLASGQTTVDIKLEVASNHGYWHSETITYTIQEHKGRKYFIKDHLGNIRTTVNRDGNVLGYDDYYPFGLVMPGRSSNSANPNDAYKFTGHELDNEAGINLTYAGARYSDPILGGRFLSIDPLGAMYPSISPYSYVRNNPINAIDPDGRAVIFVNGFPFDGSTKQSYWGSFATDIMSYFPGESAHFFDGGKIVHHSGRTESVSMWGRSGRLSSVFSSNLYSGSGEYETRTTAGYTDGQKRAAKIINSLSRNEKGVIDETIKIVTHSMGAAYSRGLVKALKEYAADNDIEGLNFEFILDITAFQGGKIEDNGINGFQVGSYFDRIAGNKAIDGSTRIDGSDMLFPGHSLGHYSADRIINGIIQWARENDIPVTIRE